ncbi:MAG: TonB-dependent receptor [Gemmatimonadota bacterium]
MIRRALILNALALSITLPAAAQSRCEPASAAPQKPWAAPLDRTITIRTAQGTLREVLDRIAAAGQVRLSYSPQLLMLDAPVCIGYLNIALGDALAALLRGTAVEPVTGGTDQIVLAPVRHSLIAPVGLSMVVPIITLPPVVATVNALRPAQLAAPTTTAIIDGSALASRSNGALAQALNGAVPGLWVWNTSPVSLLTHYGSVRGASSFGLSAPKIYIDGIEVANPLLLSRITPDAIERIEFIRGPQGAALYGADAISGVTNIITRHERVDAGEPRIRVRSNVGASGTDYAPTAALGQEHTLSFRTGANDRTAGFNVQFGTTGEYVPGAFAQHINADGTMQWVGPRSVVSGTLRFSNQSSGSPLSPLFTGQAAELSAFSAARQSLQLYTLGVQTSFQPSEQWQHSLIAGLDGYTLHGGSRAASYLLSPADSALRAAGSSALRSTLRLRSTAELVNTPLVDASIALAAEHSLLQQQGLMDVRGNSGLSAQLSTTFAERLFVTGGLRLDRQSSNAAAAGTAWLPTVGMSYLVGGPVSLKLRGAYGKSIRWPQLTGRAESWRYTPARTERIALEPEQQDGVEAGFDLGLGRNLNLQVTRFDQTASGLVQRVAGTGIAPAHDRSPAGSQLQNVGEVGNHGWEMQASWQHGQFALAGTLSLVDSRVNRLADNYEGDLQAGDRMLAVPAQTVGLMAAWTGDRWSTSVTAARASDWINYDRVALARAFDTAQSGQLPGSQLREYWRAYDGFTRLHVVLAHEVRSGLLLTLTGDNLLNHQIGEPDNVTITPGRTLSIGLRTSF